MIEAHRLAPVSQRERRIGNLRFLKSLRRLVELKPMQILHTLEKRRLPNVENVLVPSSRARAGAVPASA